MLNFLKLLNYRGFHVLIYELISGGLSKGKGEGRGGGLSRKYISGNHVKTLKIQ